ncbi:MULTISPECIES: MazG-like protein [Olivibacter]|uniref:MazG-like protein n=1 Tax=Olivibacter oleidegradans TaxID=760123 RepID=A0ABV6HMN7_9SPHI|nr:MULTISPECIES: MazG-like protein [Olivibacter]QEL02876.1 MazG-like protein [Olivibacter sp. LS-1]
MNKEDFDEIIRRSMKIRQEYHELELQHHGSKWTVEEDALAYLTDAGLVGRNIMSEQQRWPKAGSKDELEHKLGENIWWLIVLAERSGIDIKDAINNFLTKTDAALG